MESQRDMKMTDGGTRVLIVEDHPMIAELVETRLRIEGMRPTKCLGGREAIQFLGVEIRPAVFLPAVLEVDFGKLLECEILFRIFVELVAQFSPSALVTASSTPGAFGRDVLA